MEGNLQLVQTKSTFNPFLKLVNRLPPRRIHFNLFNKLKATCILVGFDFWEKNNSQGAGSGEYDRRLTICADWVSLFSAESSLGTNFVDMRLIL